MSGKKIGRPKATLVYDLAKLPYASFDCEGCKKTLPYAAFHARKDSIDKGYKRPVRPKCKRCYSAQRVAKYVWKRQPKLSERKTRSNFELNLFDKYGITPKQFEEILERQGGVCEICKKCPDKRRNLHTDHDHKTGRVRSILCSKCNQGIGLFDESPDRLLAAIDYLKRWSAIK